MTKVNEGPGHDARELRAALRSGNQNLIDVLLENLYIRWGLGVGTVGGSIAAWAINTY